MVPRRPTVRGGELTNWPGGQPGGPDPSGAGGPVDYPSSGSWGTPVPPQSSWQPYPGAAPAPASGGHPQQWGELGTTPPKSNKKPLIIGLSIGAVVLLVLGIVVAVVVSSGGGGKGGSAGDAMRGYLEALAAGDAAEALSYSNDEPGNKEFLTDEVLKQQIEHSPITDIKILNDDSSYGMSRVHVSAKFGDKVSDETISMKKSGSSWKLDAAAVKIEKPSYVSNDKAAETLTLFGSPFGKETVYVFPGWQDWGTTNENLQVSSEPILLKGLSYFSLSMSDVKFELSDTGAQAVKSALSSALTTCVQSTALKPTGCPQDLYAYDAVDNTATWSMPDLSPLTIEGLSSYSTEVRFTGTLVFPVSYQSTRGGTKTDSDNAYVYGKIDVSTSPPTVLFS